MFKKGRGTDLGIKASKPCSVSYCNHGPGGAPATVENRNPALRLEDKKDKGERKKHGRPDAQRCTLLLQRAHCTLQTPQKYIAMGSANNQRALRLIFQW